MKTNNAEIYISYAWSDNSSFIDHLASYLNQQGFSIIRDSSSFSYKGSIHDYMKDFTKYTFMVFVISDKYLRSTNCMFELSEIIRTKEYFDRSFTLVLSDADIYSVSGRFGYIQYWENKSRKVEETIKSIKVTNINNSLLYELNIYTRIKYLVGEILSILSDMNSVSIKNEFDQIDYKQLSESIKNKIQMSDSRR
ncbi:MAG: toll/interleukin-1 receptor domain-containing protein [Proteobacteria bacterium]|nr:toll/interleukin-1 receptor domain-containing protein [Pseudomonadota bacterium]